MTYLSVIIPAYNEQDRIGSTLETVAAYFDHQPYQAQVMVVDDGSQDQTVAMVQEFAKHHPYFEVIVNPHNRGKGAVVRQGFLAAKGQYLLFSDADLSAPIEEVERLLPHLEAGYDVAIGSRNKGGEGIKLDAVLKRKIMGRIFNGIVQRVTGLDFQDTQCGFKLFTRAAAHAIFSRQKLAGFSFDVEILYIAQLLHLKTIEVGVNWTHVAGSRISLIRDSIRMFRDIIQIKNIHRSSAKRYATETIGETAVPH